MEVTIRPLLEKTFLGSRDLGQLQTSVKPPPSRWLKRQWLTGWKPGHQITNYLQKVSQVSRKKGITESALVHLMNDLLMVKNKVEWSILILLYVSATFENMDHNIFLDHLKLLCGSEAIVLSWFKSFLSGWSQKMTAGIHASSSLLYYGMPQGSILSLLIFAICRIPLGNII